MKKSMVYTKTGDAGTTSLVGGVRVSKTHLRLEAYGTIDELNSNIGVLVSVVDYAEYEEYLRFVQHKLFSLGSYLATDTSKTEPKLESYIGAEEVTRMEKVIDEMDETLPPLKGFVLPGGSHAASVCHVCRTVCRRAERRMLALESEGIMALDDNCKKFINRLSDFLFVLSRKLNYLSDYDEIYWDKTCK